MNIDEMPAGREMDALIHRHLFDQTFDPAVHKIRDDEPYRHYSTDMAAAWEVVEKLKANNLYIRLFQDGTFGCSFTEPPRPISWADTAPLAICRAALKALGVTDC